MFSGCTVLPDSKETILGSSNQEASPPAGKNTGVVLVPCLRMEVCPYIYFQWCGFFCSPFVLRQMSSQWGSQKLLQRFVSHELTVYLSIFNLFKRNELWLSYQRM